MGINFPRKNLIGPIVISCPISQLTYFNDWELDTSDITLCVCVCGGGGGSLWPFNVTQTQTDATVGFLICHFLLLHYCLIVLNAINQLLYEMLNFKISVTLTLTFQGQLRWCHLPPIYSLFYQKYVMVTYGLPRLLYEIYGLKI